MSRSSKTCQSGFLLLSSPSLFSPLFFYFSSFFLSVFFETSYFSVPTSCAYVWVFYREGCKNGHNVRVKRFEAVKMTVLCYSHCHYFAIRTASSLVVVVNSRDVNTGENLCEFVFAVENNRVLLSCHYLCVCTWTGWLICRQTSAYL